MSAPPSAHDPIVHDAPLSVGDAFILGPAGVRALALREVNPKEAFTLRDASGAYFRATLASRDAERAEASVYERMPASPESPVHISLVCAVLARQRMLVVMQKATELGVSRIVPALTDRSVPRDGLAHEKAHAWPGQVVRAVRQCRRASVPVVTPAESIDTILESATWTAATQRFYLDDRAAKNSGRVSLPSRSDAKAPIDIALAIGPEGGFTDRERRLLEDSHGTPLRLGGRVLRAETAVFVGLTLLQHLLGDLAVE